MKQLIYILVILIFSACGKEKEMYPSDFQAYLNSSKSGLTQSHSIHGIKYTINYLPQSYQALKNIDVNPVDTISFQRAMAESEGHHYLLFKIELEETNSTFKKLLEKEGNEQNWDDIKTAINFNYKKQFSLNVKQIDKPCVLYHAFPGLDPSREYQFMLVFKDEFVKENMIYDGDLTFVFDDIHFSKNQIQLSIQQSDLNNIPRLKL